MCRVLYVVTCSVCCVVYVVLSVLCFICCIVFSVLCRVCCAKMLVHTLRVGMQVCCTMSAVCDTLSTFEVLLVCCTCMVLEQLTCI